MILQVALLVANKIYHDHLIPCESFKVWTEKNGVDSQRQDRLMSEDEKGTVPLGIHITPVNT